MLLIQTSRSARVRTLRSRLNRSVLSCAVLLALAPPAAADALTTGAPGVSVEGRPAAAAGDAVAGPGGASAVVYGSPNVFINGRPAATVGDGTTCGGVVTGGARGVFVNGRPLARAGDATTGCPR